MVREAKLDLDALRRSCEAARKILEALPQWERDALEVVSAYAASEEANQALRRKRHGY